MGFIPHMEWKTYDILSRMNYRDVGLENVNGQQGGAFNAHWKVW